MSLSVLNIDPPRNYWAFPFSSLVELALRQQLSTYTQKGPKPRITAAGRTFWILLSQLWSGWREALVIVQPDTVARWHRKGFRLYWRSISKRGPGQPPIPAEVQALIRRFANENDWRARKIQAELGKLGITVSPATVSRYLPKRNPDHDLRQRWKTFLRNHKDGIAAMDFIVVPTRLRDSPLGRPTKKRPARDAQVIGLPRVGGLHHRYEWQEAA